MFGKKKFLFEVLRWGVVLSIVGYLLVIFRRNINEVRDVRFWAHPWWLLASSVLLFVHYLFMALLWHGITRANHSAIRLQEAVASWFASMFGKYVPGKVFLWGARAYYYRHNGISARRVTFCFVIESVLQLLTTGAFVAIVGSFSVVPGLRPYQRLMWVLIPACFTALHPRLIQFALSFGTRLLRREPVTIHMRQLDIIGLVAGYAANILVFGAAFFLFTTCFYPVAAHNYLYLTTAFMFSGIIGLLALFAPSGLGVREGILLVALKGVIPDGPAAMIVLSSRLWITLIDIASAGAGWAYLKYMAKTKASRLGGN